MTPVDAQILPRLIRDVQNWFQNRRAKAKQQKKQEEFEMMQALGHTQPFSETKDSSESFRDSTPNAEAVSSEAEQDSSAMKNERAQSEVSVSPSTSASNAQQASYESLQRALSAAAAARPQFTTDDDDKHVPIVTAHHPQLHHLNQSHSLEAISTASATAQASETPTPLGHAQTWPTQGNDYGFGTVNLPHTHSPDEFARYQAHAERPAIHGLPDVAAEEVDPIVLADGIPQVNSAFDNSIDMQDFSSERRDSYSEELTTSLGNFGLNHQSHPFAMRPRQSDPGVFKRPGASLDIAARRNRPRPAALGTAALRSRSYAGAPSMSPTVRGPGSVPPNHNLRQVKSTNGSLNVRYAGVRKTSSAQRSPLYRSTFADAEAFQMLTSNDQYEPPQSASLAPPTPLSPEVLVSQPMSQHPGFLQEVDQGSQNQLFHTGFHMQSPPTTPMAHDLYNQMQSIPPASAPPHFTVFQDNTPPYSSGPPTTSSWCDAPFATPEYAGLSPAIHMPQPTHISPIVPDFAGYPQMQSFPDTKLESSPPQKPTEFYIQEFPQQKEAHAHAAKQLAQQKPTSYSFSHWVPKDFSSPES